MLAVVIIFVLACYGNATLEKPTTVTCATVTGGKLVAAEGTEWAEKLGKWLGQAKEVAIKSYTPDDVAATIEKVWKNVLWLWVKSFLAGGQGTKLDPQILRLREQAKAQRQEAEDRCTPCPPSAPVVPPAGGVDPRVVLTAAQATGTESESIVRGAVAIADQRGYGYNVKLAIVEAGLVESGLRLLDHGDSSSVGWLQLLSMNGTYEQRMSIEYPANWFYDEMERLVPNYRNTSADQIAVLVQRPARQYEGRYKEREQDAQDWLDKLGENPGIDQLDELVGVGCSVDPTAPADEGDGSYETGEFSVTNKRSVAQAIEYLEGYVKSGRGIPSGQCLHYMADAYGYPSTDPAGGNNWAIRQWELTPASLRHPNDKTAPRGAFLYWNTGAGRPGHIAISAGNGLVYSTDQPRDGVIGLVPFSAFNGYGEYKGWTEPYVHNQSRLRGPVAA